MNKKIVSVLVLIGLVLGFLPVFVSCPVAANEEVGWDKDFSTTTYNISYFNHTWQSSGEDLWHFLHTWPSAPNSKHYFYNNNPGLGESTNMMMFSWGWGSMYGIGPMFLNRHVFEWDTSSISQDMEVVSGRIKVRFYSATSEYGCEYAISWYPYVGDSYFPHVFGDFEDVGFSLGVDYKLATGGLFDVIEDDVASSQWTTFELTKAGIEYINKGGVTRMWLRYVLDGAGLDALERVNGGSTTYNYYKKTYYPELELEYLDEPSDEEVEEEENEEEGGSGNSTTGVSWMTPRCAWNDEKAGFRIEGDAGTEFTANLVGDDGVVASVSDSIRVNDYFYWYPSLDAYLGKFRCEVEVFDVTSTWGWSKVYVEAGNCRSYAKFMEDEEKSWKRDVVDFQTEDYDEIIEWYWITGLTSGEIDEVTLTLRQGGARSNDIYEDTLGDIVVDYMECVDPNNYDLIASRYILGAMGGVVDDLDGLILDLGNPFVSLAKGYYYARIFRSGYGILKPVSAWWYCEPGEFLVYEDEDCRSADEFNVSVHNDSELNFDDRFKDAKLCVVATDGNCEEGVINSEDFNIALEEAIPESDVLLEISTNVDEYVHRSLFSIYGDGGDDGGGGDDIPEIPDVLPDDVEDIIEWIEDIFGTAAGRWLIMIGIMAFIAVVFHKKHPKVVVILCLAVVGFGLVAGWIDPWVIVLLCVGGGIYIWHKVVGSRQSGK